MKSLYNSFKLILIFIIISKLVIPLDISTCSDISQVIFCDSWDVETQTPNGVGDVFFTHNSKVYCWVNISNIYVPQTVRFDWIFPNNTLYKNYTTTIELPISGYWSYYIITDSIFIQGNDPMNHTGIWTVNIYLDNTYHASKKFQILDHNEIIALIDDIESQFNNITNYYNQLNEKYLEQNIDYYKLTYNYSDVLAKYVNIKSDYDIISLNHNTSVREYNDLKTEYQNLITEYDRLMDINEVQKRDYKMITNEYDSLSLTYNLTLIKYQSTMKSLNNINLLLYGSIIGLIVLTSLLLYLHFYQ